MWLDSFVEPVIWSVMIATVILITIGIVSIIMPDIEDNEREQIVKCRNRIMNTLRASQSIHKAQIKTNFYDPVVGEIITSMMDGRPDNSLPLEIEICNESVCASFPDGYRYTFYFRNHMIQPLAHVQNISGCTYHYSQAYLSKQFRALAKRNPEILDDPEKAKLAIPTQFNFVEHSEYVDYLYRPQIALAEGMNRIFFNKYDIKYKIVDDPRLSTDYRYEEGNVTMYFTHFVHTLH